MKTVKITLLQDGGEFEIVKFTNTVQLSVGMRVPVSRVEEWCCMSRVQVDIVGQVKAEEDEQIDLTDERPARQLARPDTMAIVSKADIANSKAGQPF
jgi:hypothetical protein